VCVCVCVCVRACACVRGACVFVCAYVPTFVATQLYVQEQPDLDDLPEQTQHQVRLALPQVLGSDVHHVAADSRGRVQSQVQVLLWEGGESETPCPLINITRVSVTHSEVSGHSALKYVDLLRVSVLCLHTLLFVFVQNSFIYNLVRCVKRDLYPACA
jgi:hypothetical protein